MVKTDNGTWQCRLRGRLKKNRRVGDVVAIGDRVEIAILDDETGIIETVYPRQRMLCRMAPTPKGEYQQVIIANPDQVVLVFSCCQPEPHFGMLDRFLVITEKQQIPALILVNKIDLLSEQAAKDMFGHYEQIGYPLYFTSAKSGRGLESLFERLRGKISVFSGPSGVGKSTILNRLLPDLELEVNEISQANQKGRHTTVASEMYALPGCGYIADTPGLKALALWDIEPEEIDAYFVDIRPLVEKCQFSDCTHIHEPGCAVIAAVARGQLHPKRYETYVRMRGSDEWDV
jgi:ribosome biogenesis GTPase